MISWEFHPSQGNPFFGCSASAMGTGWEGAGLSLSRKIGVKPDLCGKTAWPRTSSVATGLPLVFYQVTFPFFHVSSPRPPAFEQFLVFLILSHSFFQFSANIPLFDVSISAAQGALPVSGRWWEWDVKICPRLGSGPGISMA